MSPNTFIDYLRNHISKKGEEFTHTRIGDKDLNIYGGSYYFDNEEQFLNHYYNNVFVNKNVEYITEKQLTGYAPLLFDIDMRYSNDVTHKLHTKDHIIDLMMLIALKIVKIYNITDNFNFDVFILEKDNVNVLENKTKDGIHLIFGIRTDKPSHNLIRDAIMYNLKEDIWPDLPLTNTADDLVDEGVIKGCVNWQLFGSTKPNHEPYKLKYHYNLTWDAEVTDYKIKEFDATKFNIKDNLYKLSARNKTFPILEVNDNFKEKYERIKDNYASKKKSKSITSTTSTTSTTDNDDYNIKLVKLIKNETLGKRDDWLKIIFAMKREEYTEEFAKQTSLRATGNFTPLTEEVWKSTWDSEDGRDDGLSLGTIKFYAKRDNPLEYYRLKLKSNDIFPSDRKEICSCVTEKYFAELFVFLSKDIIYVKNDDNFYTWLNNRWNKEDKKIGYYARQLYSRTLYNYFNNINITLLKIGGLIIGDEALTEINRKLIQKTGDTNVLLGKTTWLNNIWTELKSIIISKNNNIEFDCQPNLIAFNNKKYDFNKCEFTEIKREDYLSMSCNYDYIEPDGDKIKKIDKLFTEIHPNPEIRACYLSIMYNSLIGGIKKKFIIANGSGGNGKGLINELLRHLLGDYAYEGNTTVLTEKIKGGANPEIAHMNKKRLVLWKEAGAEEKLRIDTIKKITDNVEINARGLYCSSTTTKLEATNIMEVNNRLKFDTSKVGDAEARRLIDVLFESTFTDDPEILNDPTRTHVYPCDETFKTTEFKKSYCCALFKYIIDNAKKDIYIPNIVRERTNDYIESNDEFYTWFLENYEFTTNETDIIKIKDMFDSYKYSDVYNNLYKKERPTITKFNNEVMTHKYLRSKYKDRIKNQKINTTIRNVLVGVKSLINEKECMINNKTLNNEKECMINDTDDE